MLKESFHAGLKARNKRLWFSDDYFDLIVWMEPDDRIRGFQLCYGKFKSEHAVTWTEEKGFGHERIDDGESNPSKNLSPILLPDGACPINDVIRRFLQASIEIDKNIRQFVETKLKKYKEGII